MSFGAIAWSEIKLELFFTASPLALVLVMSHPAGGHRSLCPDAADGLFNRFDKVGAVCRGRKLLQEPVLLPKPVLHDLAEVLARVRKLHFLATDVLPNHPGSRVDSLLAIHAVVGATRDDGEGVYASRFSGGGFACPEDIWMPGDLPLMLD